MKYICGNCNKAVGDHLARSHEAEPLGVLRCPECNSLNAIRRPDLKAYLSLLIVFLLFELVSAVLEPTGIASWGLLLLQFSTLWYLVYTKFMRYKLPVIKRGHGA